jgi:hypothetical protein
MELKVACDCGQKYKFDVEPVEGRMPFTVNCPVCGVDGTSSANQLLEQQFASVAPAPATMGYSPPTSLGGLRINRPASAAVAPPLFASSAPPPLPVLGQAPASRPGIPIRNLISPSAKAEPMYKLWLAISGAFLGSAVGGGLVYGFFLWTGHKLPLMGSCVGLIAGFTTRGLARGGDATSGGIAAALSVLSSFCALYFAFDGYFSIRMIVSIIASGSVAYKVASY